MAESGLSIQYSELMTRVARFLGYSTSRSEWSNEQEKELRQYVQSGIRQFYYPPAVHSSVAGYEWSFLRPTTTLTTAADQWQYDLPYDFGRLIGDVYHAPDTGHFSIVHVMQGEILRRRQMQRESGKPQLLSVRYKDNDGGSGQIQEMIFWPVPDQAYTLHYQYEAFPYELSYSNPYPLGGMKYAEVIIESCLAVAEQHADLEQNVHYARFQELLIDAVMRDQKHGTSYYGFMGDSGELGKGAMPYPYPINGNITYKGETW